MTTPDGIRVSDAERDAAAASLREHFADGRITMDELNQRLDATFAAKTRSELDAVTRDLPHVAPRYMPLPSHQAGGDWQQRGQHWRGSGIRAGVGGYAPLVWALLMLVLVMSLFGGLGGSPGGIAVIVIAILAVGRRLLRRLWRVGTGSGRGRRRC